MQEAEKTVIVITHNLALTPIGDKIIKVKVERLKALKSMTTQWM